MRAVELLLGGLMALGMLLHVGFHLTPIWFDEVAYAFTEASLALTLFCAANAAHLLGPKRALQFFAIAVVLGWLAEYVGITTGLVFGTYHYTDQLGPLLLGVPYIVPLVWFCVLYVGYVLANFIVQRAPVASGGLGLILWLSVVGAFLAAAFDLVIDPFMVHAVGAWIIEEGPYFGETFHGIVGWFLVSFGIGVVFRLVDRRNRGAASTTKTAAALPIAVYAVWALFFTVEGVPEATRAIAFFAMGIPVLAASSAFWAWKST